MCTIGGQEKCSVRSMFSCCCALAILLGFVALRRVASVCVCLRTRPLCLPWLAGTTLAAPHPPHQLLARPSAPGQGLLHDMPTSASSRVCVCSLRFDSSVRIRQIRTVDIHTRRYMSITHEEMSSSNINIDGHITCSRHVYSSRSQVYICAVELTITTKVPRSVQHPLSSVLTGATLTALIVTLDHAQVVVYLLFEQRESLNA